MKSERFSEYRVMWLMVLFDLPTETKKDIIHVIDNDIMAHIGTMYLQPSLYFISPDIQVV